MNKFIVFVLFVVIQQINGQTQIEIAPILAEGLPIESIEVYVIENEVARLLKDKEYEDFLVYFNLKNKGAFNPLDYNQTRKLIAKRDDVSEVYYKTFNDALYGTVTVHWYINTDLGEKLEKNKGIINSGKWNDFPFLYEDNKSQLTLILNGGIGAFLDNNGFFGEGDEFTQGNPIADEPADFGATYWTEAYIEPGIGGISEIGNSNFYLYGSLSALFTTRIGNDIFSSGSTVFADFERAYLGFIIPNLGRNKNGKLNISAGRNFFQLNDGFLFSKYAGSSNAGDRGSVYLNARTTLQKTVLATYSTENWTFSGFFLEPQELFRDSQTNINYTGGTVGYNNNKKIDINFTMLNRTGGKGLYFLPSGELITKKGLWVINPKIWLTNLFDEGLFLKTEYAYEWKNGMNARAWYLGAGIQRNDLKFKPSIYYRFAFMEGDDPSTETYERFDPLLSSGLGNWVQGINFRKVIGNGNIVSHRIELKGSLFENWEIAMDAFFLRADQFNNLGGLQPISNLTDKSYGQEYTLNLRYFLNSHFMFMGVVSHAIPTRGIENNLPNSKSWQTFQLNLFMFY